MNNESEHSERVERRRLVPDQPFPPYSYVTGQFPHPIRDPQGHSFGVAAERCPKPDADRWFECRPYLYGLDLFNFGYYWEAHETWEQIWHAAGRSGPLADFIKGLIKLAAAGVKARERRPEGVRRHALRAAELLRMSPRLSRPDNRVTWAYRFGNFARSPRTWQAIPSYPARRRH